MGDERIDFYNLIAAERGMPPGWQWYSLQAVGPVGDRANGAIVIKGAVCTATYKSGPRKGEKNWTKRTDERELVVTCRDLDAFKEAWSQKTGLCVECTGKGQVVQRVSAAGTDYRPCTLCKATGRRP